MSGHLHRRRGADLDRRMGLTQWQHERMRGPILPMERPRRGLLARMLSRLLRRI